MIGVRNCGVGKERTIKICTYCWLQNGLERLWSYEFFKLLRLQATVGLIQQVRCVWCSQRSKFGPRVGTFV